MSDYGSAPSSTAAASPAINQLCNTFTQSTVLGSSSSAPDYVGARFGAAAPGRSQNILEPAPASSLPAVNNSSERPEDELSSLEITETSARHLFL